MPMDLTWSQVPHDVRENFIFTGYRPLYGCPFQCALSAFTLHNETFNVWTHFLPVAYFLYVFVCDSDMASLWTRVVAKASKNHMPLFPIYGYFMGVMILFATSSFAHLFNCLSTRSRHICFMLDYAAIAIYGVTAAIAYYYFIYKSHHLWPIGPQEEVFLAVTLSSALIAVWLCCWTRLYHSSLAHVIRTSAFALPFFVGSAPAFSRCLEEISLLLGTLSLSHVIIDWPLALIRYLISLTSLPLMFGPATSASGATSAAASVYFTCEFAQHLGFIGLAAAFNVSKIPERWWPGLFDVYGHSHQWFHVFIFLGIRKQFWMFLNEIGGENDCLSANLASKHSDFNTFCTLAVLLAVTGVTVGWFDRVLLAEHIPREIEEYAKLIKMTDVTSNDVTKNGSPACTQDRPSENQAVD